MMINKIDYSEYVAENLDRTTKYIEYLSENLNKTVDYSEYVAENLNTPSDVCESCGFIYYEEETTDGICSSCRSKNRDENIKKVLG